MKRLTAVLIVAGLLAVFAVPAFAATKTVRVGPQFRFGTSSLSIDKGDKVRFRWTGSFPHNVRVTSGPRKFTISTRRSGTVTKTFTRSGTYRLLCEIHAPGMKMTVRVRSS
jgi:plastocyanin